MKKTSVIKKLVSLIFTLLFVSLIAFFAFQVIPGDAATSMLGTDVTPEREEEIREELGLNKPVYIRYADWITNFIKGDLGTSYKYNIPVSELLAEKIPVTVALGIISFILIVVVSIPLGILGARFGKKNKIGLFDIGNQVFMAVPSFVLGVILIFIFGLALKLFIPGNYVDYKDNFMGFLAYLIIPAMAIAIPKIAMVVKFLKSEILNQLDLDYVRTARSKGNTELRILFSHVLKNALMPVITLLGMIVAEILAGSLIIEQVFSLPGMGNILISSIGTRDYPVVQAIVMYIAIIVIGINLLVDITYKVIDPRS